MKIQSIAIKNFAAYENVTVSFDDNVTYLIGKNGSGKSTLGISAIIAAMQGIAEKASGGNKPLIGERFRFINPKGRGANITLTLVDEKTNNTIDVIRNITASGQQLSFKGEIPNVELNQKWLNDLFNEFLIAPKRFQELSPKDQAKAIGIDTLTFDTEIKNLKGKYTEINAVLRAIGEITPVPEATKTDVSQLQDKKSHLQYDRQEGRKAIANGLNDLYLKNKKDNDDARKLWMQSKADIDQQVKQHNDDQDIRRAAFNKGNDSLSSLKSIGYIGNEVFEFLQSLDKSIQDKKNASDLYQPEPTYINERPDDSSLTAYDEETNQLIAAIDTELQDANTNNQAALLYTQYTEKLDQKTAKEKELADNVRLQKEQEEKRLEYIKAFDLPFGNMSIGEEGELLLSGKPIKEPYFSTGELLKMIPILISTRNPEFKYVFLQDFNLLDENKQVEITDYLTEKGFQLVIEYVGKETLVDKTCILLKDNVIVESYESEKKATLEV